jgi:hypothetical protein
VPALVDAGGVFRQDSSRTRQQLSHPLPRDLNLPRCVLHAPTVRPPELCASFAAFTQSVFWSSQLRSTALARSVNMFPSTSNGRCESPDDVIGRAATPPKAPVNGYRESARCGMWRVEGRRTWKFWLARAITPNPTSTGKLPSAVPVASASVVARSSIRMFGICWFGGGWCRFDVLITSRREDSWRSLEMMGEVRCLRRKKR